jgi:hypothetical protein
VVPPDVIHKVDVLRHLNFAERAQNATSRIKAAGKACAPRAEGHQPPLHRNVHFYSQNQRLEFSRALSSAATEGAKILRESVGRFPLLYYLCAASPSTQSQPTFSSNYSTIKWLRYCQMLTECSEQQTKCFIVSLAPAYQFSLITYIVISIYSSK